MAEKRIVYGMTGAEGLCGGIATANKNALRALNQFCLEEERELSVISFVENKDDRPAWLHPSFKFHACRGSKLRFAGYSMSYALRGALHIFDHVTLALPVLPLAMVGRCRTVIVAHGSEADDRMKDSSRLSFRCASLVLTNSELTLRRLQSHLPQVRGRACLLGLSPDIPVRSTIPSSNGVVIELEACDGTRKALGHQVLLLVARMDESEMEKGHDLVIRAVRELRLKFPSVQAVFPGPGTARQFLASLALELGVGDAIFFPGLVSNEMLERLYRHCFAFVMPSQQEGFGLVYLEAMNFGKPCIGCRNDGAEEVIADGETGILLKQPRDVRELTAALTRLLEDPDHSQQLGQNGFARLRRCFTPEHHQQRFRQAISQLA